MSGLVSAIGGIFGGSGGSGGVSYQTTPLDAGSNSIIDQQIARANQTPEQFAQNQNQGVYELGQKAQQSAPQASQEDQRMGYSGDNMNKAIRNQYGNIAGAQVGKLKDSYSQNAQFQKSAALQSAAASAVARQNVEIGSYERLMQAYNANEQARAQMLSSILGAGGMVAGAAMAGNRRSSKSSGSRLSSFGSPGSGPYDFQSGMLGADTNF